MEIKRFLKYSIAGGILASGLAIYNIEEIASQILLIRNEVQMHMDSWNSYHTTNTNNLASLYDMKSAIGLSKSKAEVRATLDEFFIKNAGETVDESIENPMEKIFQLYNLWTKAGQNKALRLTDQSNYEHESGALVNTDSLLQMLEKRDLTTDCTDMSTLFLLSINTYIPHSEIKNSGISYNLFANNKTGKGANQIDHESVDDITHLSILLHQDDQTYIFDITKSMQYDVEPEDYTQVAKDPTIKFSRRPYMYSSIVEIEGVSWKNRWIEYSGIDDTHRWYPNNTGLVFPVNERNMVQLRTGKELILNSNGGFKL